MNKENDFTEQEIIRREKLTELAVLGIDPYPAEEFQVTHHIQHILDTYSEDKKDAFTQMRIAGRIMSMRDMGKAAFALIQDSTGRMQVYVKKDDVCTENDATMFEVVWKKLLDLGDILGFEGYMFTTKTGEPTLRITSFKILTKSLKPLPVVKSKEDEVFDKVVDMEFKYRQRYADLIINPDIKKVFQERSKIIENIRQFYLKKGYLEVDTPVLQAIPGGATARPFITHHNALDIPLYLRIANELYLKRLIVGGFEGVFEFARDFRNEGMDRTHNPEFTILELYVAYKDYLWMLGITEDMLESVVQSVHGKTKISVGKHEIEFKKPFARLTITDAIKQFAEVDITDKTEGELRTICKSKKMDVDEKMGKGKLIDELFSTFCEAHLIQPTFIMDYPVEMSPLTKKHRSVKGLVERFELIVNGKEIANAYSELNDPIDQRQRFEEQIKLQERGDDEAMYLDNDFLRALEYGMPPCAGIGIGIDRLVMLLTNQHSIQDVLLFPQMRPEKNL